jgi:hypothetical protein
MLSALLRTRVAVLAVCLGGRKAVVRMPTPTSLGGCTPLGQT